MAEKKAPNLLQRKVTGAVKPREAFDSEAELQTQKETTKRVPVKKETDARIKRKGLTNQKKGIKLPEETYKDLSVIKSMENLKFDYEVVQMLLDSYKETFSEADMRRFTLLRENL